MTDQVERVVKKRCKVIGKYTYEGKEYVIWECQWCRAVSTKRKKEVCHVELD